MLSIVRAARGSICPPAGPIKPNSAESATLLPHDARMRLKVWIDMPRPDRNADGAETDAEIKHRNGKAADFRIKLAIVKASRSAVTRDLRRNRSLRSRISAIRLQSAR